MGPSAGNGNGSGQLSVHRNGDHIVVALVVMVGDYIDPYRVLVWPQLFVSTFLDFFFGGGPIFHVSLPQFLQRF